VAENLPDGADRAYPEDEAEAEASLPACNLLEDHTDTQAVEGVGLLGEVVGRARVEASREGACRAAGPGACLVVEALVA